MNRKEFLKGLTGIFATGALFAVAACEKEPPIPACERDRVGTVTVKNSTGYKIWTDVTWGNVVENYEKLLYNGNSYKYTQIPAGSIEIWVSFDGQDWYYEYESLSACEDMTFTWYLNARKSAPSDFDAHITSLKGECPFQLATPKGELVTPQLKVKQ